MSGIIFFEGRSELDGAPIVAIATSASANRKTGALVQTWIMRADVEPTLAARTGRDASVCGDCKLRPSIGGGCYVTLFQAPLSVWRAYRRGVYAHLERASVKLIRELASSAGLRRGSYGDPAAVPASAWLQLERRLEYPSGTAYSHQWRERPDLARYVMASVDSPEERAQAKALGFRTFRVRTAEQALEPGEIACPASEEAGKRTTCADCQLCDGTRGRNDARADIAIIVHGASASRASLSIISTTLN